MENWTPKTGKIVDNWQPKTGNLVTTIEETEPLSFEEQYKQGVKKQRESIASTPFGRTTQKVSDYLLPTWLSGKEDYKQGETNVFGEITRGGAAVRSSIQNLPFFKSVQQKEQPKGFVEGATRPEEVPSLAETFYLKSGIQPTGNTMVDIAKAAPFAVAGTVADIATDPVQYIAGFFGGKYGKQIGKEAGKVGKYAKGVIDEFVLPTGRYLVQKGTEGFKALTSPVTYPIRKTKEIITAVKTGLRLPQTATLEASEKVLQNAKSTRLTQLSEAKALASYNLNKLKDTTQQVFNDNLKTLSDTLQDVSEQGALKFQEKLPEYTKSMHTTYKTWQDTISDTLELSRGNMTMQEVSNILVNTQKEAMLGGYNYGKGYDLIDDLLNTKYQAATSNLGKTFSLQDVKSDLAKVFNTVNYDKYGKSSDMATHILRKNWGDFIINETKNVYGISEYEQLQSWYARNIDAMKMADKIFKPKQGELFSEKGASFLRKFGMAEKPALAEQKFLQLIEEGNELVEGVGSISQPTRQLGQEIKQVIDANKIMKVKIAERLDRLNIQSMQVRNSISAMFNKRIDKISNDIASRKKAIAILKTMGWAASAAAGIGIGGRILLNKLISTSEQ